MSGALVSLSPPLSGPVSIGTVSSGISTGLGIPVTAGTRLLLIFAADVTAGIDLATTISGFADAGLYIQ